MRRIFTKNIGSKVITTVGSKSKINHAYKMGADYVVLHNTDTFDKNIKEACLKADLIIIHTEWNDFKSLNFKNLVKKKNFTIYDMRNIYSHKKIINSKIRYFGIGRSI